MAGETYSGVHSSLLASAFWIGRIGPTNSRDVAGILQPQHYRAGVVDLQFINPIAERVAVRLILSISLHAQVPGATSLFQVRAI
jgi:hypothetical protein